MKHRFIGKRMYKLLDLEVEFNVSRATLYRWCQKGLIKFIRLPSGHIRIPVSEVDKLKHVAK